MRLVCKRWKALVEISVLSAANEIEPQYENPNYRSLLTKKGLCLSYQGSLWDSLKFRMMTKVKNDDYQTSALVFSNSVKCRDTPFPSGAATFSSIPVTSSQQMEVNLFWQNIYKGLLWRHGNRLLHASFHIQLPPSTLPRSEQQAYNEEKSALEKMMKCCEKTPGLQILHLTINKLTTFPTSKVSFRPVKFPSEGLPKLTKLCVDFGHLSIVPTTKHFATLKSLSCPKDKIFMEYYDPRNHGRFPSLQHLQVYIGSVSALLKLREIKGPLREVDIRGNFRPRNDTFQVVFCPTVSFFVLQKFHDTLCVLRLESAFSTEDLKCLAAELNLNKHCIPTKFRFPNLKILSIDFSSRSYNGFVDSFLALETGVPLLEIIHTKNTLVVNNKCFGCDLIRGFGPNGSLTQLEIPNCYKEDLPGSVIWKLAPRLEEIFVRERDDAGRIVVGYREDANDGSRHFTRQGYERVEGF